MTGRCWVAKIIILTLVLSCACVGGSLADDRVISPDVGFHPAHSYAISGMEAIDKATGSLTLRIPLAQLPPGPAGFTAGLTLVYNNKYWEVEPLGSVYGLRQSFSGGWRLVMAPTLELEYIQSQGEKDPCGYYLTAELFQLRLTEPDGARHTMILSNPNLTMPTACEAGTYRISLLKDRNASSVWYTADGSYLRLEIDAPSKTGEWPANSSWTVYRQDGSSIRYEVLSNTTYLRDRNGNAITMRKFVDTQDPGRWYEVMSDDFGRSIRLDHFSSGRDEVTQTGHNGVPMVWKVHYGSIGEIVPDNYVCSSSLILNCKFSRPPLMVTRLELPNGLSYSFGYDRAAPFASNYRELRTLTLPTGATVEYGYRLDDTATPVRYFNVLANPIASKTVRVGGEIIEKWEYNYEVVASTGAYGRSTHKAPDGGVTTYEFNTISYRTGLEPYSGLINRTVNPDGSIIQLEWQKNLPYEKPANLVSGNYWVRREYTTTADLSGNPVSTSVKVFRIDKNGNTTAVEERGWLPYSGTLWDPVNAPLLRKTINSFVNGATDSTNTTIPDTKAYSYAYLSPPGSPRNLPEATEVQDGSGVVKSRSQFDYVETTPSRMVGNLTAEFHWDSTQPGAGTLASGATLTPANSIVRRYEYTQRGNLRKEIDARGLVSSYDYGDVQGCPPDNGPRADLYQTGAHKGSDGTGPLLDWAYAYNCLSGKKTTTTEPNGLVTTIVYDNYGRPTTIIDGGYRKTVHTYSDVGMWIVTQRDVNVFGDLRNVSVLHYDKLGRVRRHRQLETAVSDPAVAAQDETTGILTDTRYVFKLNRNEIWVSNPYRVGEAAAPTRGWALKRMDKMGRLCVEEWFAGVSDPAVGESCTASPGATGSVARRYYALSNAIVEEVTDAAGRSVRRYNDVMGRLIAVREDPASAKYDTYYQYDALDNLISSRQVGSCNASNPVSAPCLGGQTRTFAYDSLKRLSAATNPEMEGNTIRYEYDANGNIISKSGSGSGALQVRYTYDSLNRLKTREYNDGVTSPATYCYDGTRWSGSVGGCVGVPSMPSKGQLTEVASMVSRTALTYNAAGLISSSTQTTAGKSFTFEYAYNAAFSLTSMTYPSGRTVFMEYDDAGREVRLYGQNGSNNKDYAGGTGVPVRYAPHGQVQSLRMGNGIEESRGYNSRLQLTRIQAGNLFSLSNCYQASDDSDCAQLISIAANSGDVQGQKITRQGQAWTQKYAYDAVDRLISASETGVWSQSYGYDAYGNRWVASSSGLPANPLTPSSASSFSPLTNRLVGTSTYDSRGNLKTYGAYVLGYDGDDRMIAASTGTQSVRYEYDAEGRRVRAYSCSGSASCPGGATTTRTYVYDAFGKLAAEYTDAPFSTGTSFFTLDHLESTRLETDSEGRPVRCSDYLPFGQEIPAGTGGRGSCFAEGDNAIKFTGKERDAETGLDSFGARYYSGAQGRFTSADPLNIVNLQKLSQEKFQSLISNPQNWNAYSYAHNNPLNKLDPDGYLTIIIPGTGYKKRNWSQNSDFYKRVQKTFGDKTIILNWSGGNSREARKAAADALVKAIKEHKFAPGEKLNIVAHSHGGNIAFQASSNLSGQKIDNLVTIGTPIRLDYKPNPNTIDNHVNVYSQFDGVQTKGGFTDTMVPGPFGSSVSLHTEIGPAGRTVESATNVEAGIPDFGWIDSHKELWNQESVWRKVEPLLKK